MTNPRHGAGDGHYEDDHWRSAPAPAARAPQALAEDDPYLDPEYREDTRLLTPEEQAAEEEKERLRQEAEEERIRNSYQDPGEVSGRSLAELGYWLALGVTAGADVAAFHSIVSLVMSTQADWIVWLMVAGFTACSLTLAHFAGRLARDAAARHGTATRKKVMLLLAPWAALGLIAFVVRLMAAFDGGTSVGGTTVSGGLTEQARDVAASLMFLVLYLASGAVAGFGVYLTRNPVRVAYRRSLRRYHESVRHLAKSQPPYERAIQVRRLHARSRHREENNYEAAKAQRLAFADELKRYAAVLMSVHLQDPAATEQMTLRDRRPLILPPEDGPDAAAARERAKAKEAADAQPEAVEGQAPKPALTDGSDATQPAIADRPHEDDGRASIAGPASTAGTAGPAGTVYGQPTYGPGSRVAWPYNPDDASTRSH